MINLNPKAEKTKKCRNTVSVRFIDFTDEFCCIANVFYFYCAKESNFFLFCRGFEAQ